MTKKQKIVTGAVGFALLVGAVSSSESVQNQTTNVQPTIEKNSEESAMVEREANIILESETPQVSEEAPVLPEEQAPAKQPIQEPSVHKEKVLAEPTGKPESVSEPVTSAGIKWYVSSHPSSKYYYHETCQGWQGLSEKYLKSFATEAELKSAVPGRSLHQDCDPK